MIPIGIMENLSGGMLGFGGAVFEVEAPDFQVASGFSIQLTPQVF